MADGNDSAVPESPRVSFQQVCPLAIKQRRVADTSSWCHGCWKRPSRVFAFKEDLRHAIIGPFCCVACLDSRLWSRATGPAQHTPECDAELHAAVREQGWPGAELLRPLALMLLHRWATSNPHEPVSE